MFDVIMSLLWLNVSQTNEVNLRMFLSLSIPVLVSGGSSEVSTSLVAGKDQATEATSMSSSDASYLHQFLR